MNPDEKVLLTRTAKLSEENNKILRSLQRSQRWGTFWGFIKLLLIIVPLVIGYLYVEPYLGPLTKTFQEAQNVLNGNFPTTPR